MTKIFKLLCLILLPCSLFANSGRIIFHRIPKTGGSTVKNFLFFHFSKEKILPQSLQYKIEGRTLSELSQYNLIQGHFLFPRFGGLPGRKITFLREPIQRILSAHRYYKEKYKCSDQMSKDHLYAPGDPLIVIQNHQCKFLSSLDINDPAITDKQHLESAKYNLEHNFFFVGITEDLNRGLPILAALLGFKPPDTVPTLNTTKKPKIPYSKTVLQEIRNRNVEDIELYRFAKALYEKRFKTLHKVVP